MKFVLENYKNILSNIFYYVRIFSTNLHSLEKKTMYSPLPLRAPHDSQPGMKKYRAIWKFTC